MQADTDMSEHMYLFDTPHPRPVRPHHNLSKAMAPSPRPTFVTLPYDIRAHIYNILIDNHFELSRSCGLDAAVLRSRCLQSKDVYDCNHCAFDRDDKAARRRADELLLAKSSAYHRATGAYRHRFAKVDAELHHPCKCEGCMSIRCRPCAEVCRGLAPLPPREKMGDMMKILSVCRRM